MFANWEEVFESFSEIEKDEIRAQENISDEKICADVENYFKEYVGDSTANCYGEEVPDVVNEHWIYSRKNFLWALSQKARVLKELKIISMPAIAVTAAVIFPPREPENFAFLKLKTPLTVIAMPIKKGRTESTNAG